MKTDGLYRFTGGLGALGIAFLGTFIMIGFHLALYFKGLRVMDLWGGGRLRPLTAAAVPFTGPGEWIAPKISTIALISAFYPLGVLIAGIERRDHKSVLLAGTALLLTCMYGYWALELGFVLAGA